VDGPVVLSSPAEEEEGEGEEEGADYDEGKAVFWEANVVVEGFEVEVDAVEG
jgi:hypothetical protein